jgi:hypothetical protein
MNALPVRWLGVCLIAIWLLPVGCVSRPSCSLTKEAAEQLALRALRQQGFATHREYVLTATRQRGTWQFFFQFEPRIPGTAMLVWVDDDRKTRILPANY